MKEWTKGGELPLGLTWGVLHSGREGMRLLFHIAHVGFYEVVVVGFSCDYDDYGLFTTSYIWISWKWLVSSYGMLIMIMMEIYINVLDGL